MIRITQPDLDEVCLDGVNSPKIKERKSSTSTRRIAGQEPAASSLGEVLIVSEDSMVRDFLGQMVGLLGYDNHSLKEWPAIHKEQSWQDYDAIFLESHFMDRFRNLKGSGLLKSQGSPMVVVLTPEYGDDIPSKQEAGPFRVLRKPLDYRQMGNIMDECFRLKLQAEEAQGMGESGV